MALCRSTRWEELAIILKRKAGQDRCTLKDQEKEEDEKKEEKRQKRKREVNINIKCEQLKRILI